MQQPDTAYAADRQTSVCVQKQAEVTGDSRSTREVLCPDGDSTCVRHATRAEAAAQGMASSSDEPANVDGLPRAYGRHVTGSVVAIATTGCRSDPPAASAVLTHSPSAGLPSPHMPVLAPTPEQTSDAGQQQTLTDITGLPAIPQQDASATDATVDSATAPRSDAVNGEAVSLAGAVPASPVHMACAWQSAATGQQETPAKAAGADSQGRPVSALTQAVPGLPGVSAEEVQQLLELMKSMQAAGAWPHGAPAVAEHGAHERALPAERMSDAMSVNSAVAHHMPDAASGSPAVAHHMPDAVLESPAVAHHMQALHMQPHEASGQLQVSRDATCVFGTKCLYTQVFSGEIFCELHSLQTFLELYITISSRTCTPSLPQCKEVPCSPGGSSNESISNECCFCCSHLLSIEGQFCLGPNIQQHPMCLAMCVHLA